MRTIKIKDQTNFWKRKRAEAIQRDKPEAKPEPKSIDELIQVLMREVIRLKRGTKSK
jgi:hypothetical protein